MCSSQLGNFILVGENVQYVGADKVQEGVGCLCFIKEVLSARKWAFGIFSSRLIQYNRRVIYLHATKPGKQQIQPCKS